MNKYKEKNEIPESMTNTLREKSEEEEENKCFLIGEFL
jgi:hypothetical protein